MAKKKKNNHKPISVIITVPDPDGTVYLPIAEIGGTMEWRTESINYPDFEVSFPNGNPVNENPTFTGKGSRTKPLVLHVKREGTFQYNVVHHPKGGGTPIRDTSSAGRVVPCPHCPP